MEDEMPLQEIYYVAEMIVGVAVMISIAFVAIELRRIPTSLANQWVTHVNNVLIGFMRP